MPNRLAIDWDQLKTQYIKGLPLKEIAEQNGVSFAALRTRASRYKWADDVAAASQVLQRTVTQTISNRAKNHVETILEVLESHVKALKKRDPESLDFEELDLASKVLDRLDQIGRRSHGIQDEQSAGRSQTLVQVVINTSNKADLTVMEEEETTQGATIDVETVSHDAQSQDDTRPAA